jgi:hypothetical protein
LILLITRSIGFILLLLIVFVVLAIIYQLVSLLRERITQRRSSRQVLNPDNVRVVYEVPYFSPRAAGESDISSLTASSSERSEHFAQVPNRTLRTGFVELPQGEDEKN